MAAGAFGLNMLSTSSPALTLTSAVQGVPQPIQTAVQALAGRRIFFGHQSVGGNLLSGVAQVVAETDVSVRIAQGATPQALEAPGLVHTLIGRNEDPDSKLRHFEELMTSSSVGTRADIAFFKFCYIDFQAATDADALFARYREVMEHVAQENPTTTLVHVTVPLAVVQRGPKATLKRLLGKPVWGERENQVGHRFSELLRAEYAGKAPIFDLAHLEAQRPDGTQETFEIGDARVPALVPGYSDDGGHLNAAGQQRLARQFVQFLAELPVSRQ